MRFLFVLSALIWTWLVSRSIAFGPNIHGICWHPHMHADTWYRLTPMPFKISGQIFTIIPIVLSLIAIPPLYIDNNILHITTIAVLVSEQTFIPIFVAHVHKEHSLTIWSVVNIVGSGVQGYILSQSVWVCCIVIQIIIHTWFLGIQIYISTKQPIIRQLQYQQRTPRTV